MNFAAILFFAIPLQVHAQPTAVVDVLLPKDLVLAPGMSCAWDLQFEVKSDFHIQANPAAKPNLIPSELSAESRDGVRLEVLGYPEGVPYRLKEGGQILSVYGGEFTLRVRLVVSSGARPRWFGQPRLVLLPIRFRYQACTDRVCLSPQTLLRELPVSISGKAQKKPPLCLS